MLGTKQHIITYVECNRAVLSVIRPLLPHLCPLHRLLRTRQCIIQLFHPLLRYFDLVLTTQMISRDSHSGTIHELERGLASRCSYSGVYRKLALSQYINPVHRMFQNKCAKHLLKCTMLPFCLPIRLRVVGRTESKLGTHNVHQRCPECGCEAWVAVTDYDSWHAKIANNPIKKQLGCLHRR